MNPYTGEPGTKNPGTHSAQLQSETFSERSTQSVSLSGQEAARSQNWATQRKSFATTRTFSTFLVGYEQQGSSWAVGCPGEGKGTDGTIPNDTFVTKLRSEAHPIPGTINQAPAVSDPYRADPARRAMPTQPALNVPVVATPPVAPTDEALGNGGTLLAGLVVFLFVIGLGRWQSRA